MDEIQNTYITFEVAGNLFALSVESIVEIVEYVAPKSGSSVLPYMKGLVDFRGKIIPLIDAGVKFGYEPIEVQDQTTCIVFNVNGEDGLFEISLMVDAVSDVVAVEDKDKQDLDSLYKPGYVKFVSQVGDKVAMFIDQDKVFSDVDIVSMQNMLLHAEEKK